MNCYSVKTTFNYLLFIRQLQEIQTIVENASPGLEIGSLTAADRNIWYEVKNH